MIIHSRGIDLVWSLNLQNIRDRWYYFLCVLMFKCIHGLAPNYLSNDVNMHVDIHGYDTIKERWEYGFICIPRCTKDIYKRSFLYKGSSLWNKVPPWVKKSTSLNDFKHKYRLLNGWIHPKFIVPFICPIYACVYMCYLYPYILLCYRASWKSGVTERVTLYRYIRNKNNKILHIWKKIVQCYLVIECDWLKWFVL